MFMDWACACDGLFPLPVEKKAIMESDKHELVVDLAALVIAFSPCLSRKRQSLELDKHAMFMDWACLCDGLFPLPVEEKAIMESDVQALRAAQDIQHPFANAGKIPFRPACQ